MGQLWAIAFDGEAKQITAVRQDLPLSECRFSSARLEARIGRAELTSHGLSGAAEAGGRRIAWQLAIRGGEPPLLLLPAAWYARRLPAAKALVTNPGAVFDGWLEIDGARLAIDGWRGSQNHNWGSRHTDRYAWGQVAGFDGDEDAFLECSTARVRVGPVWTPWLTLLVLRSRGPRARAQRPARLAARAGTSRRLRLELREPGAGRADPRPDRGARRAPSWDCATGIPPAARRSASTASSRAASSMLEETGRPPRSLRSESRAAFEILTDQAPPEVPIVA